MRRDALTARLSDPVSPAADFLADVLLGLQRMPKRIPPKYFYDDRGAVLFERICTSPEYYLRRAELDILAAHAEDIAAALGTGVLLLELGAGSADKAALLLRRLRDPAGYAPMDLSAAQLHRSVRRLGSLFPQLRVTPVLADFTRTVALPEPVRCARRVVAYFPGSTLGNFEPPEAIALLRRIRALAGAGGGLLLGMDLKKDAAHLERAYNDGAGVTAAFNLNLLGRINRELGGDFNLRSFAHEAFFNAAEGRIEMHLRSRCDQIVSVRGRAFGFRRGETLHTENSYKYDSAQLAQLAALAGYASARCWQDPQGLFSVRYLAA